MKIKLFNSNLKINLKYFWSCYLIFSTGTVNLTKHYKIYMINALMNVNIISPRGMYYHCSHKRDLKIPYVSNPWTLNKKNWSSQSFHSFDSVKKKNYLCFHLAYKIFAGNYQIVTIGLLPTCYQDKINYECFWLYFVNWQLPVAMVITPAVRNFHTFFFERFDNCQATRKM